MAAVKKKMPKFVIVRHGDLVYDQTGRRNDDPWLPLSRLPEMRDFLRASYAIEKRIGYLTLFRRRAHPETEANG